MDRSWRIVVPLRLSEAKTRLSTQPAPRRRELVVAMALDVIAAARDCRVVDEVRLVADAAGLESVGLEAVGLEAVGLEAVGPGVSALPDPGEGLNAAILHGAAGAPGHVAALLADVPCATPGALEAFLRSCPNQAGFLSDAEGLGTTLLAAPSAAHLVPRFGVRSRAAHAAAGVPDIRDPSPGAFAGLRRDVDSEVDLWDARRLGVGAATQAALT